MMDISIDLVYPASITKSQNYSCEPPLGLIAIYSSLPLHLRERVRILDSTIYDQKEIESATISRKADVVAVSCTTYNYPNALRIARLAKANGSVVVMGGIHVTHMKDSILAAMAKEDRPIDYLVVGYGEPAFYPLLQKIAEGERVKDLPGVCYIQDGSPVVQAPYQGTTANDPLLSPLAYDKVDFRKYSRRFHRFGNLAAARTIGSMFTQRGCPFRNQRKCVFCSIEEICARRPGHLIEADITTLVGDYSCDLIRINDAEFAARITHVKVVAEAAKRAFIASGRESSFYCFARADILDAQRVALFKEMNLISVFIGYESGSNEMLRAMHKYSTKEQGIAATRLLQENGIDVISSGLVLGIEGESEVTLGETLEFVEELKAIGNTRSVVVTPLIPLPGSYAFRHLLDVLSRRDPMKYNELSTTDVFDIGQLIELWNHYMCGVSIDKIMRTCEKISEIIPARISFLNLKKDMASFRGKETGTCDCVGRGCSE